MARISKQIGWSQESNLLYEILRKLGELAGIASKVKPYKVYSALITDNGDDTMTITELENTIGEIVWTAQATGEYRADLVGAFPLDKTWATITNNTNSTSGYGAFVETVDNLRFYTGGVIAVNVPVEIRVYN